MKRVFAILTILGMLITLATPCTSYAQSNTNKRFGKRPKIGLVLGGGGARGIAHAGVLKILEENKVPVDYIVGTSMGSIVGGLYASGYSAAEIEGICSDMDWDKMLDDTSSEKYLPFRNKGEYTRFMKLKIGLKDKSISLPAGIIEGQNLGVELKELTMHVHHIDNFDNLNIPFRCNAVDLERGEEVILKDGNLADCMRASMAVPGAFAPAIIDDRILVDGMTLKNLAVDIAQDMGADVIIAVDVGIPLAPREKLNTFLDIFNQFMNIMFIQSIAGQIALLDDNDILIQPNLGQLSPGEFGRYAEIMEIGEAAARNQVEQIKQYSVSDQEWDTFLKKQRGFSPEQREPIIDAIEAESGSKHHEQQVKRKISQEVDKPLDINKLKTDINKIYGTNNFRMVDFRLKKDQDKKVLSIDTEPKTWDKNYFRFGLNLDDDFDGNAAYNLLVDGTFTDLNRLGGEWETGVILGSSQGIVSEFYQPLDYDDRFFVSSRARLLRSNLGMYSANNERSRAYRATDMSGQFDVGMNIGTIAQFRLGYRRGLQDRRPVVGPNTVTKKTIDKAALVASAEYNTIDNFNFPKSGTSILGSLTSELEDLGAEENYNRLDFFARKAITFDKLTFLPVIRAGTYIGSYSPTYDNFTAGGLLHVSGYGRNQLGGYHTACAQLTTYYEVAQLPSKKGIYLGGSVGYGNVWNKRSEVDLDNGLWSGCLFAGMDTILGPLYFGYGMAEGKTDDGEVYLYLGQPF